MRFGLGFITLVGGSPAIGGTLAATSALCGAAAPSLERGGSVCFSLAEAVVLDCCLAGLAWAGAEVLEFGGRFSMELIGVGQKVLIEG